MTWRPSLTNCSDEVVACAPACEGFLRQGEFDTSFRVQHESGLDRPYQEHLGSLEKAYKRPLSSFVSLNAITRLLIMEDHWILMKIREHFVDILEDQ